MNASFYREFAVLAETKNYWEASSRLYLTQSTLSKHIQAMEKELDVPLFERTTRKVELTEYGRALLPYARKIADLQFEYSSLLLQKKNQHRGLVTIGCIPSMSQYQLTGLFLRFQEEFPECGIRIIEDDSRILKTLLLQKDCELAILRESKSTADQEAAMTDELIRIPYTSDYLVAVLPANHPLSNRAELTLRDLREEKFCLLKEQTMLYDLCRSACLAADFTPDIVFTSHRLDSILDMAADGKRIALLMNRHVPDQAMQKGTPKFTAVKITPTVSTRISLCFLKEAPLSQAAQKFVRFFQERTGQESS